MSSAFISYSHKDRIFAEFIATELYNRHADVFIDYQRLVPGAVDEQLAHEIREKQYFVVALSPRSVESDWVKDEIGFAREIKDKKYIIPLVLEEIEWDSVFRLIRLYRVYFTGWNGDTRMYEGIEQLASLMKLPSELKVSETKANLACNRYENKERGLIEEPPRPHISNKISSHFENERTQFLRAMQRESKHQRRKPEFCPNTIVSGKGIGIAQYKTGQRAPVSGRYNWVRYTDGSRDRRPETNELQVRMTREDVFPPIRSTNKGAWWQWAGID